MPSALQTAPSRRGEHTADRILDEAEALFAEHGFAGTTLRDVAARVGIRNPSLYNHFDGKEALYRAVLERGIGPALVSLEQHTDEQGQPGGSDEQFIGQLVQLLARRPNLARLIQFELLSGGAHLTPVLRDWIAPLFASGQASIEKTPAIARWQTEDARRLLLALFHVMLGHFTIAPFYRELTGIDLLAPAELARQTRFFAALTERLLGDDS